MTKLLWMQKPGSMFIKDGAREDLIVRVLYTRDATECFCLL
jgi:hypothetical protein